MYLPTIINPFPYDKILDSSKPKQFADDNFEFKKSGSKFSKQVENTVGKGEIARYEQFLLFPWCFSKDLYCRHVKTGLVWKRVKNVLNLSLIPHPTPPSHFSEFSIFRNI